MRNISLTGTEGILYFEAASFDEADDFFHSITEAMFPPGRRASTRLTVESGDSGYFLYQVDDEDNYVDLNLTGVTKDTADFIANSIQALGGLAMVFGYSDHGVPVFLNPRGNFLVRNVAEIDGQVVVASGPPKFFPILDWICDNQRTVKSRYEK